MILENETALVEAILFLENQPMDIAAIARASGLTGEAVKIALENIEKLYSGSDHGIELRQSAEGFRFIPKQFLWNSLKDRYGKKSELRMSKAALETLAIIAYSQPVTRAEIDSIRGVSSDNMIRLLQQKMLIQEIGRKEAPGRPAQFGTTREFLNHFKLSSIVELPKLESHEREKFELNQGS